MLKSEIKGLQRELVYRGGKNSNQGDLGKVNKQLVIETIDLQVQIAGLKYDLNILTQNAYEDQKVKEYKISQLEMSNKKLISDEQQLQLKIMALETSYT